MQKLRRILALLGVLLLAGMYVATLIFALSSNPNATNMLMAAVACTVIIPCLLYGMALVARVLDRRNGAEDGIGNAADETGSKSTVTEESNVKSGSAKNAGDKNSSAKNASGINNSTKNAGDKSSSVKNASGKNSVGRRNV